MLKFKKLMTSSDDMTDRYLSMFVHTAFQVKHLCFYHNYNDNDEGRLESGR